MGGAHNSNSILDHSHNFSSSRISDFKTKVVNDFISKFQKLSFLVYGLGSTGQSVINFLKNNIKNYKVWDDNNKDFYKKLRPKNLKKTLSETNYIVLSPV